MKLLDNSPRDIAQAVLAIIGEEQLKQPRSDNNEAFNKIIAEANTEREKLHKLSQDRNYKINFLNSTTDVWQEKCKSNYIPRLTELAKSNNISALLVLFKIHCLNLSFQHPSLNKQIKNIDDATIMLPAAEQNILSGYKYLLQAAYFSYDEQRKALLTEFTVLIAEKIKENPDQFQGQANFELIKSVINFFAADLESLAEKSSWNSNP